MRCGNQQPVQPHHIHKGKVFLAYLKKDNFIEEVNMSLTFHVVQLQVFSSRFHVLSELHIQLCL